MPTRGSSRIPTHDVRGRIEWPALIGFIILCLTAAAIGGALTTPGLGPWYESLHKPPWTPASWVFGPVWTVLYVVMAVAVWMVWRERETPARNLAINLFLAQLALNVLWSAIFFTIRNVGLAMAEIAILWLAIVATALAFAIVSRRAAVLMAPYLAWVTYASALNYAIYRMN